MKARNYRLTNPFGKSFEVKARFEPELVMYSTRARGNIFERDDKLNIADIIMQDHGPYYDWTIDRLPDSND